MIRDKITKKSVGYGFVKFFNEKDAKDAIGHKNGLILGNKKLKVTYARPQVCIVYCMYHCCYCCFAVNVYMCCDVCLFIERKQLVCQKHI